MNPYEMPELVRASDYTPEIKAVLYAEMEKAEPDLWGRCYPRHYSEAPACGQYYSPKSVARELIGVAMKMKSGVIGKSEQYEFLFASQLCRFRVPMFWLGKDLAVAISKTIPPMALEWNTMPMPFEAMTFMVPKGTLVHPLEGDASFIGFARFKAGERLESKLLPPSPYASINGAMTIFAKTEDGGHLMHWNIPYDSFPTLSIPDLEETVMRYTGGEYEHQSGWINSPHMTDEDNHFLVKIAHMVFGALLLMTERKDLVTPSRMLRRITRPDKPIREYWSPNILGEKYTIKKVIAKVGLGGTHASPRLHWVRGSYKMQAHGANRSLRKQIWIEPYLRGAEEC